MSRDDRVEVLLSTCRFGRLPVRTLRELGSYFDEVSLPAGTAIATQWQPAHELIVVAEGTLSVRRADGCVTQAGAGATIGYAAMETRGAHDATVVASTDARLLVMSHAQFRAAVAAVDSKPKPRRWALPTSRRSLPHRQHLERA